MSEKPESKQEMIERLLSQWRRVLEEKLPEEPGTLEEIERITEEIGSDIKRDMEESCASRHGSGYAGPKLACRCGGVAEFKEYHNKRHVTLSSELVIARAYYYCKKCGSGFSPLDAKMGLDSFCTSIGVRSKLGRLAVWIPFERLSRELVDLCDVHLSKNTIERVSESMGEQVKLERSRWEREVFSGNAEEATAKPSRLYIGIDGTGVGDARWGNSGVKDRRDLRDTRTRREDRSGELGVSGDA